MRKKKIKAPVQDKPKKHVYSDSDILYSEGFALDKYELADTIRKKERKEKRVAKGDIYSRIMKMIEDRNIMDFYRLSNLIREEFPELEEGFYDRASTFKAHIDSRRYAKAYGFGELDYTQVCKTLEETRKKLERVSNDLKSFQRSAGSGDKSYFNAYQNAKKVNTNLQTDLEATQKERDEALERIETLNAEISYLKKKLDEANELLQFEKLL